MYFKYFVFLLVSVVVFNIVSCRPSLESSRAMCNLPEARGRCRALLPRWRYDSSGKKCVLFNFGGCEGNANNFLSEGDCAEACHD
ncbi:kappaPI-actitoxin-Avd3c-like [Diabrotica undecimpunctata]|uniref:kappaPI-actitoxin-Avd3c-like n=1 Tax=Diabrotica undecimpunctata TaxID=50387 RepID=UPI003B637EEC